MPNEPYWTPHRRTCLTVLTAAMLLTLVDVLLRIFEQPLPYLDAALRSFVSAGGAAALYFIVRRPAPKPFLRLHPVRAREAALWLLFGICISCAGAVLSVPLNLFWAQFTALPPGLPVPQNAGEYLLGLLCTAVVPALCEETLCRGIVLREYEAYGARPAVWASAIAFSLLHGAVTNLVFSLLLGLVLALITVRTGSLYPAMIVHFSVNAFSLTMGYVTQELIAPHWQSAFSLALNLLYAVLSLTFVFSFLWLLYVWRVKHSSGVQETPAKPRFGFSVSLVGIAVWYLAVQLQFFF